MEVGPQLLFMYSFIPLPRSVSLPVKVETSVSYTHLLGSSYSMRGYYEGRYRDKCAMDAQIELRQHVWKRNGVAAVSYTHLQAYRCMSARIRMPNGSA